MICRLGIAQDEGQVLDMAGAGVAAAQGLDSALGSGLSWGVVILLVVGVVVLAGAVLLLIYLTLILKGLSIASKAKDKLGRLIAVGVVTVFTVQVFVNIGVTTGILPVTGLTLPFMSYGGSSVFSTSIMLGLLLNVSFRRYDF